MKRSSTDTIVKDNSELKPFNEAITIVIPVQSIYERLLNEFPETFKHREMVAHAIIGTGMHHSLSYVYNALAGFTNQIDFKVGEMVICTAEERYEKGENDRMEEVQIGQCKVIGIDLYSDKKLQVEFEGFGHWSGSRWETKQVWVDHTKCSKVPPTTETEVEVVLDKGPDEEAGPQLVEKP